jgi:hypothetical protein
MITDMDCADCAAAQRRSADCPADLPGSADERCSGAPPSAPRAEIGRDPGSASGVPNLLEPQAEAVSEFRIAEWTAPTAR